MGILSVFTGLMSHERGGRTGVPPFGGDDSLASIGGEERLRIIDEEFYAANQEKTLAELSQARRELLLMAEELKKGGRETLSVRRKIHTIDLLRERKSKELSQARQELLLEEEALKQQGKDILPVRRKIHEIDLLLNEITGESAPGKAA